MTAIALAVVAAFLIANALLLATYLGRSESTDAARYDEPLPTYEPGVPVDRWDDPAVDRHIATAVAISHGADAAAIQRSVERSQAAVKGLLASRDELAKRRAGRL